MQLTHQISDAELIQSYTSGNDYALECLIRKHKDRVFTAIFMLVKDRYTAEDLFQDVFLKIVKTIKEGRYSEQGKFLPWALRVAHNMCMDYFRKVKQPVPVVTTDGVDIFSFLNFTTENAETQIIKRQTASSLRKLVEALPEEQREVIVLRIYGELSFKEIAALTQVSINTALGRMRYALINLKKAIQEKNLAIR